MKITGTSSQIPAGQMGISQRTDAVSREIKNQIAAAQKRLQAVSSDTKLGMEEKMKKRQEIQKEITDLQNQLRQHEIEMRQEEQQGKSQSQASQSKEAESDKGSSLGISQEGMQAMISADAAVGQAETLSRVQTNLEGKARVLKGEIKMDASRGSSLEQKEEAFAELEKRAEKVSEAGFGKLREAFDEEKKAVSQDEEKSGKEENEERINIFSDVEERKPVNVLL